MTGGSRDTKGCRFGVKLERTQFRTPEYLARFTLLSLWTAVGQAVGPPPLQAEGSPPLPAPGGHLACRVRLSVRFIQRHLPLPQLRAFAWLQTAEATS